MGPWRYLILISLLRGKTSNQPPLPLTHTHCHTHTGCAGECSPFQPLPLEKAIKIHAVQILVEGFSTQVVVDRPGSEGTEKHFIILIQQADAMLRPHPFPDFGNANTQGPEAPPFQEVTEIAWMILQTRAECVARAAPGLGYSSEHVDGITTANNKHETGTCCHG